MGVLAAVLLCWLTAKLCTSQSPRAEGMVGGLGLTSPLVIC